MFHRSIIASVDKVKELKAVVALHKFVMPESELNNPNYCPKNYTDVDGPNGLQLCELRHDNQNRQGILPINNNTSKNYSEDAHMVGDSYKEYFSNEGAVD